MIVAVISLAVAVIILWRHLQAARKSIFVMAKAHNALLELLKKPERVIPPNLELLKLRESK